tara:strand:+ start:263 stop:517 length:255 start_codon:yes stop_codon:yes gene_type:complete
MKKPTEQVKRKRGRPSSGLTKNELVKRSKARLDTKNMSINGELLRAFNAAKEKHSEIVGFKLNTKQFFSVLVSNYNKSQNNEET